MAENITKVCSRSRSQKLEFLRVLVPNPFAEPRRSIPNTLNQGANFVFDSSHLSVMKDISLVSIGTYQELLRIPGKIANSLRNEPHKRATLYIPHGKFWHVGIRREGDNMYLDEGWKEFAKALDLRTGYFVLFQYEVNMVFSVKIFDNTMCFKEYVHDSFKRSIHDLYEDTVQTAGLPRTDDIMCRSLHSLCKRQKLETDHIVNRKQGMEKRDEGINNGFLNTSPLTPRFVKIIKSSHLTSKCLGIPKKFCMRHGLVSERELFLVSTTGKSWPVQFFLTLDDGKLNGFSDFARDNGLREGNRCTFNVKP